MFTPERGRIGWLFVDFNAYFASVEQQLRPELRDRPIVVVPVDAETTCCIAVSYEARQYGIRTGTEVRDARRLCPEILLIKARQEVYAAYHHKIVAALERCIPVERVQSIDEMACRLTGSACLPEAAIEIAKEVKRTLRQEIGASLRCSIGLAANPFLAKVASEMRKPDGLVLLDTDEIPKALAYLKPRDLPGIGERMEMHLTRRGITTFLALLALDRKQMRALWGSIVGERYWYWLRGYDLVDPPSMPASVGHQHVLPPPLRTRELAGAVARKLLCQAAARLRHKILWARGLSVYLSFSPGREKSIWECHTRISETQDTFALLEIFGRMWAECPEGKPTFVGVELYDLVPETGHTASLLPGEAQRARLTQTMDAIHQRFGTAALFPGSLYPARNAAPRQIAFSSIPDFCAP